MATEEGIVTKVSGTTAWIKTTKSSSCKSCSARGSCSPLGGGKEMIVQAVNQAKARVGDLVMIGFETHPLLKLTFLLYIVPVFCLLTGAIIGDSMAADWNMDPSLAALMLGLLGLVISFILIKIIGSHLAKREEYQAKIIRILKKENSSS